MGVSRLERLKLIHVKECDLSELSNDYEVKNIDYLHLTSLFYPFFSICSSTSKGVEWLHIVASVNLPDGITFTGRSISQKQRKGWQWYTNCCFDLEIIVNHVKGMEILLASSYSLYASYALCWHSIFWPGAFLIFSCGEFLKFMLNLLFGSNIYEIQYMLMCKYLQILMIALVEHLLVLGMLFLMV